MSASDEKFRKWSTNASGEFQKGLRTLRRKAEKVSSDAEYKAVDKALDRLYDYARSFAGYPDAQLTMSDLDAMYADAKTVRQAARDARDAAEARRRFERTKEIARLDKQHRDSQKETGFERELRTKGCGFGARLYGGRVIR